MKTNKIIAVLGAAFLLTSIASIAQDNSDASSEAVKKAEQYDGKSLNLEFTDKGVGKRKCIPITLGQVSTLLLSPGGPKLTVTTKHRWESPVTIEEFNAGGTKAYSIGGMVASQTADSVVDALLPMGPGTLYVVLGDVKLLGHTIKADKSAPLIFVVHNVSKSKEAESQMSTTGPLAPIKFAFDDSINPKPEEKKGLKNAGSIYLQLVHLQGKGLAVLADGSKVEF